MSTHTLAELSQYSHRTLKLDTQQALSLAAKQQIIAVGVAELSQACTCFPLFLLANNNGSWTLGALGSFAPQSNLFLVDDRWQASYLPLSVQTYPFFLINAPSGEGYRIGIDTRCGALSEQASAQPGDALFDAQGKASAHLSQVTRLLEGDVQSSVQTQHFIQQIQALSLLKTLSLTVHYRDGSTQKLSGLRTIDEDRLAQLDAEQLHSLHRRGVLLPLHALLISLSQVNQLIQQHNRRSELDPIARVSLEVAR